MQLLVIGLNHKTAPVAMREQLAFAAEDLPIALDSVSYTHLRAHETLQAISYAVLCL